MGCGMSKDEFISISLRRTTKEEIAKEGVFGLDASFDKLILRLLDELRQLRQREKQRIGKRKVQRMNNDA
jgi:hypothetical protein